MSTHEASILWKRETESFTYDSYSRDHEWTFPTHSPVAASAAKEYRGNASRLNPEEALVASISSCHMLTFLAIAAREKWVVDRYEDRAVGFLEKDSIGRIALTRTVLRPVITFSGDREPSPSELASLHERAHKGCFIANSVKTEITVALSREE